MVWERADIRLSRLRLMFAKHRIKLTCGEALIDWQVVRCGFNIIQKDIKINTKIAKVVYGQYLEVTLLYICVPPKTIEEISFVCN